MAKKVKKNKQKHSDDEDEGTVQVLDGNGNLEFNLGDDDNGDDEVGTSGFAKILELLGKKKKKSESDPEKIKKQKMVSKIAALIATEIENNLDLADVSDEDLKNVEKLAALLSSPIGKAMVTAVKETHRSDYGLEKIEVLAIEDFAKYFNVRENKIDEFKKFVAENSDSTDVKHMMAVIEWDYAISTRGVNPMITHPNVNGSRLDTVDIMRARRNIDKKMGIVCRF